MEEAKKTAKKNFKLDPLYNEIFMLLFLGFSIFLTFCLYSETFGSDLGEWLRSIFYGLVGIGAWFLPPIMVYHGINRLFLKRKRRKLRGLWGTCFFLCFISLVHAIGRPSEDVVHVSTSEITRNYYFSGSAVNGGVIGGVIGDVFFGAMGRPGAILILLIALAAMGILFSGRSLTATVRAVSSGVSYFVVSLIHSAFLEADEEPESEPAPAPQVTSQEPSPKPKQVRVKKKPQLKDHAATVPMPMPVQSKPAKKIKARTAPRKVLATEPKDDIILLAFEDCKQKRTLRARKPMTVSEVSFTPAVNDDAITVHGLVEESEAEEKIETEEKNPLPRPVSTVANAGHIHSVPESPKSVQSPSLAESDTDSDWIDDLLASQLKEKSTKAQKDPKDPVDEEGGDNEDVIPIVVGEGYNDYLSYDLDEGINKESELEDSVFTTSNKGNEEKIVFADSDQRPDALTINSSTLRSMSIPEGLDDTEAYVNYKLPPIDFLNHNPGSASAESREQILENSYKLEETLRSFKVEAKVVEVSVGPTVTRYELAPGQGVKVNSIANLSNDLALSLAASGIRIEAPIPGKSAVGIEIPNKDMQPVYLREIIEDDVFRKHPSKLAFATGKDIAGNTVVADIAKMPHLLIAGATGSGKSVCINTLIASILYKAKPNEVKLLMIDPKVVELSVYNGIPHLLAPVVTDCKKAAAALNWAVAEMDIRYNLFAECNVRDIKSYNEIKEERGEAGVLPQIVIIIDELADLMMMAKGEIEELICRLAQKARAAGLHLIVATQRPSVDVITGLIKANIPSRLAFSVSSGTDSRTVLDMTGAEKLLGKGDMLFLPVGLNKPVRIQCGYISDREVESIVDFLKEQSPEQVNTEMAERVTENRKKESKDDLDEFYDEAVEFLISKGKGSASMLQRQFRIGYNRASRLIEELEAQGIVGPEDGSKPRKVLITMEQWRNQN